jgi:hypothetical protein
MKIEKFEDIEAWQVGRNLTQAIYQLTAQGKLAKGFGLPYGISLVPQGRRDQIQRTVKTKSIIHGFMGYLRSAAPRCCLYDS